MRIPITRDQYDAVLLDLDGVITDTANIHAACWKQMFDEYLQKRAAERGEPFHPFELATDYRLYVDGKPRFDGVRDFLKSRGIQLPEGSPDDAPEAETVGGLGNRKNDLVNKVIEEEGVEPYEGIVKFIHQLRHQGFKIAVVSFYSDKKGGKFCINGVTGPDEYNAVVNNNAYTNLMARENLRYAAQTVEALRSTTPDVYKALAYKTTLEPLEVEAWARAAESMYVPYDDKLRIIPQDDDFLDREPWDFQNTPRDHYPLLLFYHPLNIYRKQVIKQADVVLAMFLLGNAFSPDAKQRNFEFYDPLTTGDSSLSSCIEAIIAAQIGDMDKAFRYGMAALLMDLADVGGNVKDGCHIASMGGTWMMLTYGFGGMRDDDGTLSFWPRRAPEEIAILRFLLTYRAQMLEVEIGPETVQYSLREGERLVIHHEKEEIQLTRENPLAVRPVSRR